MKHVTDIDVNSIYLNPICSYGDPGQIQPGFKKGELQVIGTGRRIGSAMSEAIALGHSGKSNVMLKYLEYMSPMERLDYLAQVAKELRGVYDLEYSDEKPEPTNVLPGGRARFVDLDYNETFAKLLARAKVKHGQ